MNIDLMVNKSGNTVVDKKLVFDQNKDIYKNCVFMTETSILTPKILIMGVDYDNICKYNYMRIPAFDARYYYVTDIACINRGILITGKVDVLKTYKKDILNSQQLIVRQENEANYLLPDSFLIPHAQSNFTAKNFGDSLQPNSNKYYIQIAEGGA